MAKAKSTKTKSTKKKMGGPFVIAAIFCQEILEDSNGLITANKIINGFMGMYPANVQIPSPLQFPLNLLIMMKNGDAPPGEHTIQLKLIDPEGGVQNAEEHKVMLNADPAGGINIKSHVIITVKGNGVYWTEVIFDEKCLTCVPFMINLKKV